MIRIVIVFCAFLLPLFSLFAQENSKVDLSFTGFVRYDAFFDTRQVESLREGNLILYPKNEVKDIDGKDINDKSNFNMLVIQTRFNTNIKGPDALGAKTFGYIEAEYFGNLESDINGFRLRHAFIRFDWDRTSVMLGQFWHPMFILDVLPTFNLAVPLIAYSRNPQIRVTQNIGALNFIFTALTQRDFRSTGPDGISSTYLRNSVLPDLDLQLMYKENNNVIGAGIDFKVLTPRLKDINNKVTDEVISSVVYNTYLKLSINPLIFKMNCIYGENVYDLTMIGGYAAKESNPLEYTNYKTLSIWSDISFGKELQGAILFGYLKNFGANDNISKNYVYARSIDMDNLLRIAPSVIYSSGKTKFVFEIEYDNATYGTPNYKNKGKVEDTKSISNLRFAFSTIYNF